VTEFIVGEGREKFQTDLTDTLQKSLAEKNIMIHNALIRHVNVPDDIITPIQNASIAVEQDLTNQEKQNTAKKLGLLNTQTSMIDQRGAEVAQQTAALKATIKADQDKSVAEIQAETIKQTAEIKAKKTKTLGKAGADKVSMVEGEKAKGFQLKAAALGDPQAYTLAELAKSLNPDVRINILHAGEGTLWTDIEKARLGDLGGAKILGKAPAKK
ncbi:MAG: SPFH domain-containing protein, partial [Kiritimatiellaeota bacterium]|nr:SPFH domain-containing protein [Kiritimatiellota bacterium]